MLWLTCDASVHLGGEETFGVDSWQAQHFSQGICDRGSCTNTGKHQPIHTRGIEQPLLASQGWPWQACHLGGAGRGPCCITLALSHACYMAACITSDEDYLSCCETFVNRVMMAVQSNTTNASLTSIAINGDSRRQSGVWNNTQKDVILGITCTPLFQMQ